jgi:tight adherence protein B
MAGTLLLVFVIALVFCLPMVLAPYWVLVVRPERKVLDRLRPRAESTKVLRGVLKPERKPHSSAALNALLLRIGPLTAPVSLLLTQAGSRQTAPAFLGLSAAITLGVGLVGTALTGWLVGAIAGLFLGAVPFLVMRWLRTKRLRQFEEHFPEAIDLVSRALRAGHALPTGLGMVADEMPAPIGKEFRILFDEQNFGLTLPDALRNFARRIPIIDARFFVVAVLIQRESGGNLAEVLDNLSTVIRGRFTVKREIRTKSAHGRSTGWVLAMLPPGLFLVNGLVSGGASIRALTEDPLGVQMIKIAIVLQVLGTLAIRKITTIEY